jgi:hypothetical protein
MANPPVCISKFARAILVGVLAASCAVAPAHARVKKIQITAKESPTFDNYSWPGVGQYEKIVGKAFGELDPNDLKNRSLSISRLRLVERKCCSAREKTPVAPEHIASHTQG